MPGPWVIADNEVRRTGDLGRDSEAQQHVATSGSFRCSWGNPTPISPAAVGGGERALSELSGAEAGTPQADQQIVSPSRSCTPASSTRLHGVLEEWEGLVSVAGRLREADPCRLRAPAKRSRNAPAPLRSRVGLALRLLLAQVTEAAQQNEMSGRLAASGVGLVDRGQRELAQYRSIGNDAQLPVRSGREMQRQSAR